MSAAAGQCDARAGLHRCLRDASHRGDHVAANESLMVTWANDDDDLELQFHAALEEVEDELRRAEGRQPALNGSHEGWAVIKEELDELWEHVRADTGRGPDARHEAIQVATTALRYAIHVAPRGEA